MRLALMLGYRTGGGYAEEVALTQQAERCGYAVVWVAEAYGTDAVSVLGFLAGQTSTIGLGSAIMQIPARSAAMTAMTAATLDLLSGNRFHLGLGVSGPQVSEGWHGVRFAQPLGRTREYVDVVRLALARKSVEYAGRHITLPLPDGAGKALKIMIRPPRADVPIYLASVGPKNLELAGEIADGWLGIFFSPEQSAAQIEHLRAGARRAGKGGTPEGGDPLAGFDICPTVPVSLGESVEAAGDALRDYTALYVGGMGSREQNFYFRLACDLGYEAAANTIQDRYLAREYQAAAAAVPLELIDETALIGPAERIRERMTRYAAAGVTTLNISPYGRTLEHRLATLQKVSELL